MKSPLQLPGGGEKTHPDGIFHFSLLIFNFLESF